MKSGFPPSADADLVTTLMRAGDTPAIAALADGFTLHNRLDDPDRVHHMAASRSQNGCPRHTVTALTSTSGWKTQMRVAAYRLFWFDPITGVVLVGRSSRDVGVVGGGAGGCAGTLPMDSFNGLTYQEESWTSRGVRDWSSWHSPRSGFGSTWSQHR